MNIEICKKCSEERNKKFLNGAIMKFGNVPNRCLVVFAKNKERKSNDARINNVVCAREIKDNNKSELNDDLIDFEDIELIDNSRCPYHIEHQLYDWNKENEQRNL